MRFDFGRERIGQDDIFARVGGIFAAVCVRSILVLRRVAAQMETRLARFVLSSNAVFVFGRRAGERALRLVAARHWEGGGGHASALGAGVGGSGELGGARRAAAVGRRGAAGGVGAGASDGAAFVFVGRADGAFGRSGARRRCAAWCAIWRRKAHRRLSPHTTKTWPPRRQNGASPTANSRARKFARRLDFLRD